MMNRYTANKRLRSNDAYTADERPDMRPDRTTIVYANIQDLYPDVPIVIGGIEALFVVVPTMTIGMIGYIKLFCRLRCRSFNLRNGQQPKQLVKEIKTAKE